MNLQSLVFFSLIALGNTLTVAAAPTPIPGGAAQMSAIPGKVGQTLWNGFMRLDIQEFRDATPDEEKARGDGLFWKQGSRAMFVRGIVRNGCATAVGYGLDFALADKDDVTVKLISNFFEPIGASFNLEPGSAGRFSAVFPIDKDFVPVKLLVSGPPYGCTRASAHPKPFRIALSP